MKNTQLCFRVFLQSCSANLYKYLYKNRSVGKYNLINVLKYVCNYLFRIIILTFTQLRIMVCTFCDKTINLQSVLVELPKVFPYKTDFILKSTVKPIYITSFQPCTGLGHSIKRCSKVSSSLHVWTGHHSVFTQTAHLTTSLPTLIMQNVSHILRYDFSLRVIMCFTLQFIQIFMFK